MGDPLVNQVSRERSFDPAKLYAAIVARQAPAWLGDYDLNDQAQITRAGLAGLASVLLADGAILAEAGGTIGVPVAGVNIGSDALASAGTYVGTESQLYAVAITVSGPVGMARYAWKSQGNDNPAVPAVDFPVTAIAPDLATAQGNPGLYGHPIGTLGLVVYFLHPLGTLTAPNSWIIPATFGAHAPTVSGTTITIPALQMHVRGSVQRVPGATLTYASASSGISLVYAEWTRRIVTHVEDPALSDPLSERPTAWREQWVIALRATDTSAALLAAEDLERRVFPIYAWDRASDVVTRVNQHPYTIDLEQTQGTLTAERLTKVDQNKILRGLLARRDRNAHGNYVVRPLGPQPRALPSTNTASAGKLRLSLPPIFALVEGLEFELTAPTELEIDQATDTAHVTAEAHTFASGTDKYLLNKAAGVPAFPVKQITQVTATVQVGITGTGGYEAVTRGGGTDDALVKTPVSSIVRISNSQGGAADYTQGTHYSLVGNGVHWITGAPTASTTYYVVYRYTKVMVPTTDYLLSAANELDFSPAGDNPVDTTAVAVDYDYYLGRNDVVFLRPNGTVDVVRGLPAELPIDPPIPRLTLPYVRAMIAPNATAPALQAFRNDAMSMDRLCDLADTVDRLLRDTALQDLLNQARARAAGLATTGAASANFLDVLAEQFATLEIVDFGQGENFLIDTEAQEGTMPFDQTVVSLTRTAAPGAETDVQVGDAFCSLPFGHELAIDSSGWSQDYPVNPYADFTAEPPALRLTPGRDQWVDTTTSNVSRTRTVQNGQHEGNRIVKRTTRVTTAVTEVPALYMRQLVVNVVGAHFWPGERVRLKFDHKDINFTADSPSTQGADAFTVLARASDSTHTYGDLTGHFTIPANVPAGTVAVEFWGDNGASGASWPGGFVLRGTAMFTSLGTQRTIANQTLTILVRNDPIAQSLLFPVPRMLSKVEVPLAAKAANKAAPLIFELRETDRSGLASTPTEVVLARTAVEAVALTVGPSSTNAQTFPDPVMMPADEFRALVLRSASNAYRAYVAQLGGPNRQTGGAIGQQQIPGGIFLDSSNNADWTPRQGWDLRCRVYVAKMTAQEAHAYYSRVTVSNLTGFYLSVDQVTPDGTAIAWQYSTDGVAISPGTGKVWHDFTPFTVTEFAAVASTLDIRAILTSSDPYVTPSIHLKNAAVVCQANKLAGTYTSIAKSVTSTVDTVHGGIELRTPAECSQTVWVSLDDGATWTSIGAVSTGGGLLGTFALVGTTVDGWLQFVFTKTGLTPVAAPRMRMRLTIGSTDRAKRPRARRFYLYGE